MRVLFPLCLRFRRRLAFRKENTERGALPRFRFNPSAPFVHLSNLGNNGEPNSRSRNFGVAAFKQIKDTFVIPLLNTRASIPDKKFRALGGWPRADCNGCVWLKTSVF